MTDRVHELFTPYEACRAGARQAARDPAPARYPLRGGHKGRLELEVSGLLMAARGHGFVVAIEDGKPVVIDVTA